MARVIAQNQDGGMRNGTVDFKYFTVLAGMFVATVLISNTIAQKPFQWGPFVVPAGVIIFPLSYIFGDVLTEVYGYGRTRQVIWTGFLAGGLMAASYWTAIALPAASFWRHQEALETVLGQVPRIVLASVIAYLAGEFVNSFVLAKMKIWTRGRHLWSRTIGSTVVGQAVDTMLFVAIAFGGAWPTQQLMVSGVSLYAFKVVYEVVATPLTYMMVRFLKQTEGIDYYDTGTRFTPFRWGV